jgi:hypothetical protein
MGVVELDAMSLEKTLDELERAARRLEYAESKVRKEQQLRHVLVRRAAAEGASQPVIAAVASLSQERVRQILNEDEEDAQRRFLAREEKGKKR